MIYLTGGITAAVDADADDDDDNDNEVVVVAIENIVVDYVILCTHLY
jgi:hypothetical protein